MHRFALFVSILAATACSASTRHGTTRDGGGSGDDLGGSGNDLGGSADGASPGDDGASGSPDLGLYPDGGVPLADGSIYDVDGGDGGGIVADLCPATAIIPTGCLADIADESTLGLCNGLDDDCDLMVDEGCSCTGGAVQPCFLGPPGRRHVGACQDGMQQCMGSGEFGHWGDCVGGIRPMPEVCDGLDNDCNGCTDEVTGCVPMGMCPGPGDPRVPDGMPFTDYPLHGEEFFSGTGVAWSWSIVGGPCDDLVAPAGSPAIPPTYTLTGGTSRDATFHPTLSGDYTVTMTVLLPDGTTFTCTWIVHIVGPGLRVEMCYPESTTKDLDLFLSKPGYTGDWYTDTIDAFAPSPQNCSWGNCEATVRATTRAGVMYAPVNWGLAPGPLAECNMTPHGLEWTFLGHCNNPRLDVDNNLSEGIGLPENINVDDPLDASTFRVMVQNFTGTIAHPIVNVYCSGHRIATFGTPPDELTGYMGTSGYSGVGAMWRVADVLTHVDASGTTTCDVTALHPPGATTGYDVTFDNPRY